MPRKRTPILTDAELRLMTVLWDHGAATVHEVLEALPRNRRPAYNSILTTMRILEQKGYLGRDKQGRSHVYRPLISRGQARRQALRHMVSSMFDNSPELLLVSLLENKQMTPDEIDALKKMVDDHT